MRAGTDEVMDEFDDDHDERKAVETAEAHDKRVLVPRPPNRAASPLGPSPKPWSFF